MHLETKDLMSLLGVSRSWVNTHLRGIGTRLKTNKGNRLQPAVSYDAEDILKWINDNAVFERQTKRMLYSSFGQVTDEEAENAWDKIQAAISIEAKEEIFETFLTRALPEDLLEAFNLLETNSRHRTAPWVAAEGFQVEKFENLMSIKAMAEQLQFNSDEMVYREIYRRGMIRVTVKGRVWYMADPEAASSSLALEIPAVLL